jgi:CheY-like chemotaxis protein
MGRKAGAEKIETDQVHCMQKPAGFRGGKMGVILVIDDDLVVRRLVAAMLLSCGHEVVEANDGVEGINQYRRERPDCVITDMEMPNKGGLEVIQEIRHLDPGTQVLAISGGGNGAGDPLSRARAFPGVLTLEKPVRRPELLEAVQQMLTGPSADD